MKNVFNDKISEQPFLVLNDIKKNFGNLNALKGVYLRSFPGKAMGILGENGAGKSTLMNILSGIFPSSSGNILLNGFKFNNFKNIKDAEHQGISIIHQEIACFNEMTVLDNIFAGHEIKKYGFVNYQKQKKQVKEIFGEMNMDIRVTEQMSHLTIAEQQMVEIAKAILRKSKLIIFDEPTSSLSKSESETLFKIIAKLKHEGISICYISHKLEEIPIVCDYITIIRDGNFIGEYVVGELTEDEVISKMVGREISEKYPEKETSNYKKRLMEVKDFSSNFVKNINFTLFENEILGFSGLVGAQRTELFKSIIGFFPKISGHVFIHGESLNLKNVNHSIKKGIYYITEDRKNDGLILDESIRKNISMSSLNRISNFGFVNQSREKSMAKKFINKMSIKTSSSEINVRTMSGGNQQKVLLAKAFAAEPKIMIFDEPTRGVDVGSRREIYDLIYEVKRNGIGTIVISSDMPEVIGLCNRVIIMKNGRITGQVEGKYLLPEEVIKYAI